MDPKQSAVYQPTKQAVTLLHDLANLASNISTRALIATYALSSTDLNNYLSSMHERAAEIQRLIQEIQKTEDIGG